MKHDEFYELLPDYAKGGLEEAEIRTVDAHLADCSDCANELSELRRLQERFAILAAEHKRELPTLSPDFVDRLMQLVERHNRSVEDELRSVQIDEMVRTMEEEPVDTDALPERLRLLQFLHELQISPEASPRIDSTALGSLSPVLPSEVRSRFIVLGGALGLGLIGIAALAIALNSDVGAATSMRSFIAFLFLASVGLALGAIAATTALVIRVVRFKHVESQRLRVLWAYAAYHEALVTITIREFLALSAEEQKRIAESLFDSAKCQALEDFLQRKISKRFHKAAVESFDELAA